VTKRRVERFAQVLLCAIGVLSAPVALAQIAVNCPIADQTGTCTLPNPVAPLLPAGTPKFVNELPQPVFFSPDRSGGVFDYYEIFSGGASLGLASPTVPFGVGSLSAPVSMGDTWDPTLPTQRVWLGLADPTAGFCRDIVPQTACSATAWRSGLATTPTGARSSRTAARRSTSWLRAPSS